MAYTYDANGNMTSDGEKCFQYNEANQMDKVTTCGNNQTIAEYIYDYTGMRMVKRNFTNGTLANTVTSWSDAYETKVIVGGATENTTYYFANKELIAKKNSDGSKQYVHSDHLGSTNVVTNQSGGLVEATAYDPWGKVKSGGTASKFQYTGQEKDAETGLNYYNARYYDTNIRRFTQPDDIIQNVYDPQSLNRYAYARNNPLRYTDPTGHAWWDTVLGFFGIKTQTQKNQPSQETLKIVKGLPKNSIPSYTSPIASSRTHGASATTTTPGASQKSSQTGTVNGASIQMHNSKQTTIKAQTTQSIPQSKSYVDIGFSSGVFGPLGGGAGIQINTRGLSPYISGGLVTPGKGIAALYSPSKINGEGTSFNLSATAIGAYNGSYPLAEDIVPLTSREDSFGLGFPFGGGATINKNLGFYTWEDLLSD